MSEKSNFPVDVEIDVDGIYIVSCPIFKACHADGKTIGEALDNLREIVEMCLDE
ncbi:MAG TPA: type II toxin-antitoxin system HicB family antitoxin [Mucilaginibacter sp.]|jgi:predicted RNase H-like HicB family nuclease